MRYMIYVIHDVKAAAFLQPWFCSTDAIAVRAFSDCVNDPKHNFGMHPEDYSLFCIGDFHDSNAEICLDGGKRSLGNGVEFVSSVVSEAISDEILSEIGSHLGVIREAT